MPPTLKAAWTRQASHCPQCKIIVRGNLARHQETHEKKCRFTCHVCGKEMRQQSNMDTHIRTHTHDPGVQCPDCLLTFLDPAQRTKHRIAMHNYVPKRRAPRDPKAKNSAKKNKGLSVRKATRLEPYPSYGSMSYSGNVDASGSTLSTYPSAAMVPQHTDLPTSNSEYGTFPAEDSLNGRIPHARPLSLFPGGRVGQPSVMLHSSAVGSCQNLELVHPQYSTGATSSSRSSLLQTTQDGHGSFGGQGHCLWHPDLYPDGDYVASTSAIRQDSEVSSFGDQTARWWPTSHQQAVTSGSSNITENSFASQVIFFDESWSHKVSPSPSSSLSDASYHDRLLSFNDNRALREPFVDVADTRTTTPNVTKYRSELESALLEVHKLR